MGVLILIISLILIIAKFTIFIDNSESTRKKFLIFSGVILIIVFSLRNAEVDLGSDLNNYYRLYSRAIQTSSLDVFLSTNPFEKGYLILNWMLSRIIKWPQFILIFQSAFCIGITFRFIFKHTEDVLMSVFAFMSFGLMQFYLTGFRQSIAICICLVALEMAENKKLTKFILLMLLAISIHQTSVVFLPVYFLIKIRTTKLTVTFEFILVLVLSQIVPKLISLGNDVFEKNYTGAFSGNSAGGLINIFVSLSVLMLMYLQIYWKMKKYVNSKSNYLKEMLYTINSYNINYNFMPLLIFGTGFYVMRYQALILERISLYFTPTLIILLPYVINTMFDEKSKKVLRIVILVGMIFLAYWRLKSLPYLTIL